jgi:hypothetical protein
MSADQAEQHQLQVESQPAVTPAFLDVPSLAQQHQLLQLQLQQLARQLLPQDQLQQHCPIHPQLQLQLHQGLERQL